MNNAYKLDLPMKTRLQDDPKIFAAITRDAFLLQTFI